MQARRSSRFSVQFKTSFLLCLWFIPLACSPVPVAGSLCPPPAPEADEHLHPAAPMGSITASSLHEVKPLAPGFRVALHDELLIGDWAENNQCSQLASSTEDDPRPGVWETSEYMMGRVATYIIFVESNGGEDLNLYNWDSTSIEWAKAGIYKALRWWESEYPFGVARLTFLVPSETIIGYTKYEPMTRSKDDCSLWVPDVLSRLGYGEGRDHLEAARRCAHSVRTRWGTDWAFIIFVINSGTAIPKFPDVRAFAYLNGPYVVLPFGWFYHMWFEGTDGLARTVAHEVGHIFGATDEYNGKTERGGYLYEEDVDGSGCIMDNNEWCISSGTRRQLGWVDDNYNGCPDVLENDPEILVEKAPSPVTDEATLALEGTMRLKPYPCRRPSGRSVTINRVVPLNVSGSITAIDGKFDSAYERFRLTYTPDLPGRHRISITVADGVRWKTATCVVNVLYTYILVVGSKQVAKPRVDIGSLLSVEFSLVWAHDRSNVESGRIWIGGVEAAPMGNGWFSARVSSSAPGKFSYSVDGAEAMLATAEGSGVIRRAVMETNPVDVVFDRVRVELVAYKSRVDVGSEAPIAYKGYYEYDGAPFQGKVLFNLPLVQGVVGRYTYTVASVKDELYGLTAFGSNSVDVVFDRVTIQLTNLMDRVQVGRKAEIAHEAHYEYDGRAFDGELVFNRGLVGTEAGKAEFYVASVRDRLYGLTACSSDRVTVTFDELVPSANVQTAVPFVASVSLGLTYRSDGAPVTDARVSSGDMVLANNHRGEYTATVTTASPLLEVRLVVNKEGFDEVAVNVREVMVGNAVLYSTSALLCVVALLRVRRRRVVRRAQREAAQHIACPRCGRILPASYNFCPGCGADIRDRKSRAIQG